jgi:hypothetical protein
MTTGSSISQQLERQSVVSMESTIPTGMTIEQWRRRRSARPPHGDGPPAPSLRRGGSCRSGRCDHLHDTTTRYDPAEKQLSFLLVCPTCGTEKAVETVPYEPQFQPHHSTNPAQQSAGATIHQLPARRHQQPIPRAA